MDAIRISPSELKKITDSSAERNIYVHDNPIARDIFWQRLEELSAMINKQHFLKESVLDFGGGSGVFSKTLSNIFARVTVIDLEPDDANNIKSHFKLKNVEIKKIDILLTSPQEKYSAIIAADVLEHFADLTKPVRYIKQAMSADSFLFVSLPTENLLYEIGRKIVSKTKPADHFHAAKDVIKYLQHNGFTLVDLKYSPKYLLRIPLFAIATLKLTSNQQTSL